MTTIAEITGTFDRAALDKLTWPIAWTGEPDREYEGALAQLVRAAREALATDIDAVAVRIEAGEIVSTVRGGAL